MFRIGVRDLTHAADLETTMAEISDLADVCVEAALAICQASPSDFGFRISDFGFHGHSPFAIRFAVLGLGKLGGRELHYHSDLDVLFVYGEPAEPPEGIDQAHHSPLTTHHSPLTPSRAAAFQAAERLAGELLQAIGERTRHGVVFEIDARLRPFGKEGQLARTVESYRDYYAQRGETWERLALTRARFVAGDEALGEELLTVLRAAAFEPGLSAADRTEIQHVKHRIETERLQAGPEAIDLKLTPGGVLDVEFLVQVLQLEHGRDHPEVCTPNTSAALVALREAGLLAADDADFLLESYRRLRRLEMRLQLVSERASAVLPEDEASLAAAARRLEYRGDSDAEIAARLRADYEATLSGVRAVYERVVGVAG
jgi:glutamate-ammonia-ligase adenylyltransferase